MSYSAKGRPGWSQPVYDVRPGPSTGHQGYVSSKSRKCKALCVRRPVNRASGRKTRPKGEAWVTATVKALDTSSVTDSAARRPGNQLAKARAQLHSLSRESGRGAGPEPAPQELGRPAPASLRATSRGGANLCSPA